MFECKECGYRTENENQGTTCPVCGKTMERVITSEVPAGETTVEQQLQKKKGKAGLWGIIATFAIIFVVRIAGGLLGNVATNKIQENSEKRNMEKFIEKVEEYTPGTWNDEGYKSKFWGIRWEPDEKWTEVEKSEMADIIEGAKKSALESAEEELEGKDISESLKEKFKSTIYGDIEASYDYIVDGQMAGRAYMMVVSAYGIEESDDAAGEMAREFVGTLKNSTKGTTTLAGKEYDYVEGVFSEGINSANMRVYFRTEGVMMSMMQLVYSDGYEEIIEEFESSISKY